MSNASVHNLAQDGKISEILAHLTENPSDLNLKDAVSYFSISIFKLKHSSTIFIVVTCDYTTLFSILILFLMGEEKSIHYILL
jgi:hypothetical protein